MNPADSRWIRVTGLDSFRVDEWSRVDWTPTRTRRDPAPDDSEKYYPGNLRRLDLEGCFPVVLKSAEGRATSPPTARSSPPAPAGPPPCCAAGLHTHVGYSLECRSSNFLPLRSFQPPLSTSLEEKLVKTPTPGCPRGLSYRHVVARRTRLVVESSSKQTSRPVDQDHALKCLLCSQGAESAQRAQAAASGARLPRHGFCQGAAARRGSGSRGSCWLASRPWRRRA